MTNVRSAGSVKLEIPDIVHDSQQQKIQSVAALWGQKHLRDERGQTRASQTKFQFVTQE